ncbi:hypothetical protein A2531_02760 [Candidatus Falkowbacteria bacterium RIFOXYD2_FULL_34_120]|uniref:Uncharacterized protein n=1 Tax=Candidatus Falkowbacteria bacterium RIFOXYD2_FULL_34_120 TaxID=1798007 RepID=A0A1F5TS42_9BACT|nr:MAG: hypothetical protein A2466_03045 [Candidatus Falkowbacteria bacterium RIFOXYC2_FULL_34_220]OGF39434.1 MAG: hypothetical protein A2515_03845 [Candidatus Falkowbacteria bacterium RIFOXYD12_FULL_34_57]OGF41584.1 MAG: hypothetical protein A2531_02760 [Candidatus Falkowbacteria bacterium RIFOXYD2_FULL_34_120]
MPENKKTYLVIVDNYVFYNADYEIHRQEIEISEEDFNKKEVIDMIKKKYRPQKFPPGTHWFIKILTYLGEAQAPVIERFYLESYTEDGVLSKTSEIYNF